MKFTDTNGQFFQKNISQYRYNRGMDSRSKGQQSLGEILLDIYPHIVIYQELPCFGTKLKLDFFISLLNIAFEFDGIQHKKINSFFHKNCYDYLQQKNRDARKEEWCEANNFRLIRVVEKDLNQNRIKELINGEE